MSAKKANLEVETLEARELLSISPIGRPEAPLPPDYAGSTQDTARLVELSQQTRQTLNDTLPSAADVDMYKVYLRQGERLAVDIDKAIRLVPISIGHDLALHSQVSVVDGTSGVSTPFAASAIEPDNGLASSDPAFFYTAASTGYHFIQVGTTASDFDADRDYRIHLHRVILSEGTPDAQQLQAGGAFAAWTYGDTLHVSGPTGYGFALRAANGWSTSVTAAAPGQQATAKYSTTGIMYLKTPVLDQEIALQAGKGGFGVTTKAYTNVNQFGEVSTFQGTFGLSPTMLGGLVDEVKRTFGLDLSATAIAAKWTIKTGSQVRAQYGIDQVLDGVPYLAFGSPASINARFGSVGIRSTDASSTVLIADPADPFLYVGYKKFGFAGSLHGRIPFAPSEDLPTIPGDRLEVGDVDEFFGHVYARGNFPLKSLPIAVGGEVTVDLDANDDGLFLGGRATASQLFAGQTGEAISSAVRDLKVGVNGWVNAEYVVPVPFKSDLEITVPLGQASAILDGVEQSVRFKGVKGNLSNPWQGTVLAPFHAAEAQSIAGYATADGRFSVSTTSTYIVGPGRADLTITVNQDEIAVKGTARALGANVQVTGAVQRNGNFHITGSASLDTSLLDGNLTVTLSKNSAGLQFFAKLDLEATLKVKAFGETVATAKGQLEGTLRLIYANGSLKYRGTLSVSGSVRIAGQDIGFDTSVSVDGRTLSFSKSGYKFSLALPI